MNGKHIAFKCVAWVALLGYLLILAFFAFRPFQPIPGRLYGKVGSPWDDARSVAHFLPGNALEASRGVSALRKALVKSGQLTIETVLQTDSLDQGGPARIVTFSRSVMERNFTLGQSGNALVFRLRTSETEYDGQHRNLLVPGVLDPQRMQHLVVTYDGSRVRLYVDGQLHPESLGLGGDFSGWGRNHVLAFGDEPPGGRAWCGRLQHVAMYDRALAPDEVATLGEGTPVSGAVWVFEGGENVRPLNYRNVFVTIDGDAYNLDDCLANIFGFVPLGLLVYFVLPAHLKTRRAVLLFPALLGLFISGIFELTQRGIYGRVPTLLDIAYNLLGAACGGWLLWSVLSWRRRSILNKES